MQTDDEKESARVDPFRVLKALAEISIVIGTGLFVFGWSYLYGYYHLFGLSASELTFSPQAILTYSLPVVLKTESILVIASFFVLFVLIYLVRAFSFLRHPIIVLAAVLLSILAGSRYAGTTGRANAKRDASLSTSTLPYVKLYGSAEPDLGGCSLDEWNFRLLLRTNGQIYVVLPIDNSGELVGTNLRVCSFPESRVQAVRIQIGLEKK